MEQEVKYGAPTEEIAKTAEQHPGTYGVCPNAETETIPRRSDKDDEDKLRPSREHA